MSRIAVAGPWSSGGADAETRDADLRALNKTATAQIDRGQTPEIGVKMAPPAIEAAARSGEAHRRRKDMTDLT